MTNKSTKKALALSIISLVVCVSMLVGTTFAWFTDSVTSANNIIKAGNLKVSFEWLEGKEDPNADNAAWKDASQTAIFDYSLWEPGYTEVRHIKIGNEGSLALKYVVTIETTSPVTELAKVIDVYYVDPAKQADERADFSAADKIGTLDEIIGNLSTSANGALFAGEKDVITLALKMQETAGNDYQGMALTEDQTPFSVKVFATQLTHESDSFGNDYDNAAPWTGTANTNWYFDDPSASEFTLKSAEDLAGFAALVNGTATAPTSTFALTAPATVQDCFEGKTVKLAADLDLHDISWTPIGRIGTTSTDFSYSFKGTFDGQNHVISNLKVDNSGWAGLFGLAHSATIKNVKLSGVSIKSNRMAGSLVGQLYGSIDNCHVEKANIIVVPNAVGDSFDNGDKVGGIVGWLGDNGNNRTLTNCSATETEVSAYRDVGGIAGYVASSTTVSGNKVKKVQVIADQTTNYYGDKDVNAGLIYGRTGGTITDSNNTIDDESSIDATYSKDGLTLRSDGKDVTLYLVPADYDKTTVTVPEGVNAIGGYAFAYNKNIDKIVLPSSVTTLNNRAFRDTSASEVVLNEGLTNISYQAFRNALNVTSVEIPSTVTTISMEAFQHSGIENLTVPATVTTIEYGAMRDMKELVSVTIDGNVNIPLYAFRACTKLRTVILNGDDVTFGAGSRGMIFTNYESGNGSAITVYVANETVKDRLLAADTAAKDYGGYKIVIKGDAEVVSDAGKLQEVLTKGDDVILGTDVKTEAATTAPYGNKYAVKLDGGVIDGNGNELYMECYGDDYGIMTSGGTVKNLTIKEGCRAVMIMYPQQDVILDNVNIGGDGVLYPINTGEAGADGVKLIVTNSVLAGWTSFSNIESASFTNVEFKQGTYYNDIYGRVLKPYVNTTLTNCSFVKAMNFDLSSLTAGHKIVIKNCTVDGKALNASVMTVPTTDAQYDTELFTVDLPSWASSISDCIVFE